MADGDFFRAMGRGGVSDRKSRFLHSAVVKSAARYSQKQLQTILDESQPRVSDLLRGKMSKFSLEMLVIYAEKLGLHTEIRTKKARSRGAAAGHALAL